VARLQAAGQEEEAADALAQLRAAAQAAAAAGGPPPGETPTEQEFQGRQRSLQALNPEISVNADVFAQVNESDTDAENFFAREFEISIISNLDPFSRAKIFISRHSPGAELTPFEEGGHDHGHDEGGFAVEEGYVEWVGLPGGLRVKLPPGVPGRGGPGPDGALGPVARSRRRWGGHLRGHRRGHHQRAGGALRGVRASLRAGAPERVL
jgi:hypothetical protein